MRIGGELSEPSRGEQTRALILEAALPLFSQHGFAGTSVRAISARASVNVAAIGYHFGDKQGLYLAVIERLYAELGSAVAGMGPLPAGVPPLEILMPAAWHFVRAHRAHLRLLVRHVLDEGRHAPEVLSRWAAPMLAEGEGLLAGLTPGWEPARRRLALLTLSHAMVRFALEDEAQLAVMLGQDDENDELIAGWFVDLARVLLSSHGAERGPVRR